MKPLLDTLWGRVAEKLAPGLTDVIIDNDFNPIIVKLSGAINTEMLAIDGDVTQWADFPFVLDAIQSNTTSLWASQMLREKAMHVTRSGSGFAISNDEAIRMPMATNSHMVDLKNTNIQTFWQDADIIQMLKKKKFAKTFGVSASALTDVSAGTTETFNAVFSTIKLVHNDNIHGLLDARMRAMGHTYAKGVPILYGYTANHNQSSFLGMHNWANGGGVHDELNMTLQHVGLPGVKWYVHYFGVGMNGTSLSREMTKAWEQEGEPTFLWDSVHTGNTVWPDVSRSGSLGTPLTTQKIGQFYCVPVIDDGSGKFNIYHSIVNDMPSVVRNDQSYPDARYVGGAVGIGYRAASASMIMGSDKISIGGKDLTLSDFTTTNWSTPGVSPGWSFLPFMTLPGLRQYMLCSDVVVTSESYEHNGKTVVLKKYEVKCTDYCTSFDYEWYVNYYTSGFGLYKPRDEVSKKRTLDSWKGLEGVTYFINLNSIPVNLTGKEIDELDIRKAYKRAREKACKVDNFFDQKFNEKYTWGQIRDKIAEKGTFSAFIAANDGYQPALSIKKSLTSTFEVIEGKIKITTASGEVTEHKLNEDTVVLVFTTCSNAPRTKEGCIAAFGSTIDDWDAFLASIADFDAERNNPYLNFVPGMVGRNMLENYYFPWQSLGISGYPIYNAMSPQARTIMVCRMVGDLDKMLAPFIKIINSFTTEAVISKLKLSA